MSSRHPIRTGVEVEPGVWRTPCDTPVAEDVTTGGRTSPGGYGQRVRSRILLRRASFLDISAGSVDTFGVR